MKNRRDIRERRPPDQARQNRETSVGDMRCEIQQTSDDPFPNTRLATPNEVSAGVVIRATSLADQHSNLIRRTKIGVHVNAFTADEVCHSVRSPPLNAAGPPEGRRQYTCKSPAYPRLAATHRISGKVSLDLSFRTDESVPDIRRQTQPGQVSHRKSLQDREMTHDQPVKCRNEMY